MPKRRALPPIRRGAFIMLLIAFFILSGAWALTLFLQAKGLDTAANIAQLLSLPLSLLPFVPSALSWFRGRRGEQVATPESIAKAKEHLAMLVSDQWRTESQIRALDDPDPVPIQWQLTTRNNLLNDADDENFGMLTVASSDDVADLVTRFRRLRRPRLAILGDAGTGKTTLAVQIVLELLNDRLDAPNSPVPVLMSFAGWGRTRDLSVSEWLVSRITHDYRELSAAGFGSKTIESLVTQRHVLPVLDGLDEIPQEAQEKVIAELNQSMDGTSQLIITSRTEEFSNAIMANDRPLTSAVILEPIPLTPQAAATYVQRCLGTRQASAWRGIIQRLRDQAGEGSGCALATVAATPLGLWLLRASYITPMADPSPLLHDRGLQDAASLQAHLFDRLIDACIDSRPPSDNPGDLFRPRNRYSPSDVKRWLQFIALNLDRWKSRDFDWLEDAHLLAPPSPRIRKLGLHVQPAMDRLGQEATRLTARRSESTAMVSAIALAMLGGVGICVQSGVAATLAPVVPSVSGAAGIAMGSATFAILLGILVRAAFALHMTDDAAEIDWGALLTHDYYVLRAMGTAFWTELTLSLTYGVLTGLVSGVTIGARLGTTAGQRVGLLIGGAVALLLFGRRMLAWELPPNPIDKDPLRYHLNPVRKVRDTLVPGTAFGIIGGVYLAQVYTGGDTTADSLTVWLIGFVVVACWTILIPIFGIVLPTLIAVSHTVVLGLSAVLSRQTEPRGEPHEPTSFWLHEKTDYILRLTNVALVVVLLSAAVSHLWWWGAQTPAGKAYDAGGIPALAALAPDTFSLRWSEEWRYVAAPLVAASVLLLARRVTHRAVAWMSAAVAGIFAFQAYPVSAASGIFELRLSGGIGDQHASFRFQAAAGLKEFESSVDLNPVELLSILDEPRTLLVISVVLVAILALDLVHAVRPYEATAWWFTKIATAPPCPTGTAPR